MANLSSLNTLRSNGLGLVETVNETARDASGEGAFNSARLAAIGNIATALEGAENASVPNVLAYGASRAILQFALNHDASKLDKADKAEIGFAELPAASPAKRRLSQYHSRFRKIAEEFDTIPQSERDELMAGTRSFLTVYDGIGKREKAAAKAKADAEAAQAAEAAIETAKAEGLAEAAKAHSEESDKSESLADILAKALIAMESATMAERLEANDTVAALVDLVNAAIDEETAPEAIAA